MTSPEDLQRLISRHREEASPSLYSEVDLTRGMDLVSHSHLEADLVDWTKPWEVLQATQDISDSIPDEPGLYMFVWRPGPRLRVSTDGFDGSFPHILYIGQAGAANNSGEGRNTLRRRFKGEYRAHLKRQPEVLWTRRDPFENRNQLLSHYFQLVPLEYWYTVVEDRTQILGLEKRFIRRFSPPLNGQNIPKFRAALGKTRRVFIKDEGKQ